MKQLGENTRLLIIIHYILLTISMYLYSGGTYRDTQRIRYDILDNFLSDLGRTTSHSGNNNTHSSIIFCLSMIILMICFVNYFFKINYCFQKQNPTIILIINLLVVIGVLGLIGVVMTPYNIEHYHQPHIQLSKIIFYVFAGVYGLYGYLCYKQKNYGLAMLLILCASITFGYVMFLEFGPELYESDKTLRLHVVFQKVTITSLISVLWTMTYLMRI